MNNFWKGIIGIFIGIVAGTSIVLMGDFISTLIPSRREDYGITKLMPFFIAVILGFNIGLIIVIFSILKYWVGRGIFRKKYLWLYLVVYLITIFLMNSRWFWRLI